MTGDGANVDPPASSERMIFEGQIPTLLGMTLQNTLLAVVSFGFYRFWGRTRVRQYLWHQTTVLGDRFEYTGTGGELLRGFGRALLVLLPLGLVGGGAYAGSHVFVPVLAPAFGAGLYAGSTLLGFAARYSARRYRLSRTRWRGIRGTQIGSPWRFAWLATWTSLLTLLTLGLYAPFRRMRLLTYELEHTYFGDRAVRFDGSGEDLLRHWVVTWLLLVPTLGLAWFWYDARAQRYLANRLTFDELRFAFPVSGMQIFRRTIGDVLLVVLTLGLGTPLVVLRRMRFLARHLTITGTPDFAAIAQGSARAPATGEGWLDLFDLSAV